jgi:UDP-2,3-diacylglucosamine hydrolase
MSSMKAEDIMDVTPEAVQAEMQTAKVTRMIHGHTHRPAIHKVELADHQNSAQRMVLGDWDSKIWWIEASENKPPTLKQQDFPT